MHATNKNAIIEKINNLLAVQDLDIEIMHILHIKESKINEWKNLESKRAFLEKEVSNKRNELKDLDSAINAKNEEIESVTTQIQDLNTAQSASKKADEYNHYQQKIIELKKSLEIIEEVLDSFLDKKTLTESQLQSLQIELKEFCNEFIPKANSIYKSISNLNNEGQELIKQKEELVKNINPKLMDIYTTLLKKKRSKVVVMIEDKFCSGCNVNITDHIISVAKKQQSITRCEYCNRILYFEDVKPSKNRSRKNIVVLDNV